MHLFAIMTYNDSVGLSRPKLFAHLTISHFCWDECEKLGFSPVDTRPVLVIDSNKFSSDLFLKVFPFREFNISVVIF